MLLRSRRGAPLRAVPDPSFGPKIWYARVCGRLRSTAIKKQSYIRFATSFPGAGRPTTSDARHSLQFAVNIWQCFQMPTHGRKGPQQIGRTAHRHGRRQALQNGYGAGRGRFTPSRREARPQTEAAKLRRASGRPNSPRAIFLVRQLPGARVAGLIRAVSVDIERRRGSIHDLLRYDDFLDAFEAREIKRGVEQNAFYDRAQPARPGLTLDGLSTAASLSATFRPRAN
jgi:hypothetical protein